MKNLTKETVEMVRQGLLNSEWCGFSKRDTVNQLCDLALRGLEVNGEPVKAVGVERVKVRTTVVGRVIRQIFDQPISIRVGEVLDTVGDETVIRRRQ